MRAPRGLHAFQVSPGDLITPTPITKWNWSYLILKEDTSHRIGIPFQPRMGGKDGGDAKGVKDEASKPAEKKEEVPPKPVDPVKLAMNGEFQLPDSTL